MLWRESSPGPRRPARRLGHERCARFAPVAWRSTVQTMHEHERGEERFAAAAQAAERDARYSEGEGAM
jgi:hypothetical protein